MRSFAKGVDFVADLISCGKFNRGASVDGDGDSFDFDAGSVLADEPVVAFGIAAGGPVGGAGLGQFGEREGGWKLWEQLGGWGLLGGLNFYAAG